MTYPMHSAPLDGTRILLHHLVLYLDDRTFEPYLHGSVWQECRWIDDKDKTGSDAHWEPWCGRPHTRSSDHVSSWEALEWMPLPNRFDIRDLL